MESSSTQQPIFVQNQIATVFLFLPHILHPTPIPALCCANGIRPWMLSVWDLNQLVLVSCILCFKKIDGDRGIYGNMIGVRWQVFFSIMKEKCARKRVSLWNRFSFFLIRNGGSLNCKNCKRSRSRCFRITRAAYLVCLSQKSTLARGTLRKVVSTGILGR